MGKTTSDGFAPVNAHLMQVLHFDNAELAINREGRMSDAQRTRQLERVVQFGVLTLLVFGAVIVLAGVGVGMALTAGRYSSDSGPEVMVGIVIAVSALAFGLVPVWSMVPRWQRNRRALADGVVTSIEGTASKRDIGQRRYALLVKDDDGRELGFNIPRVAHHAFGDRLRYRVHFIPLINYVVSAEDLDV